MERILQYLMAQMTFYSPKIILNSILYSYWLLTVFHPHFITSCHLITLMSPHCLCDYIIASCHLIITSCHLIITLMSPHHYPHVTSSLPSCHLFQMSLLYPQISYADFLFYETLEGHRSFQPALLDDYPNLKVRCSLFRV